FRGLGWGMVSAVGYMVANLGLRDVAQPDGDVGAVAWAIWVSANKAAPVMLAAWILVGCRALRGLPALPPRHVVVPLILTGLLMQWGGNVCFQFALSRVGLALSVPLCFATILVSAAIIGRLAIGDPLTSSTLLAVSTMIAAITVLTQGTQAAAGTIVGAPDRASTSLAVAAACLSGIAYGAGGVVIRRYVRVDLSHSATIMVLSTTGVVSLGGASLLQIGPDQLMATPPDTWSMMLFAGAATAVAFFAISLAYQHQSAVKVNLLNGSQTAMSALAGVVLFGEPNTTWLQAGTVLTIVGLILSARPESPQIPPEDPIVPPPESGNPP
ncbi:MAG: DMT family transporter, partial [Planctomycetaceae bacterium]|nr:DMT family transporter [Planctomycetaceae bacterium]